ncbi:MAG: hypothetical protein P8X74_12200 [Reinekea sp.]
MFTTSHLHILVYTIAGTQALVAALVFAFAKEKLAAAQPRLLSGIFLLMAIVLLDMSLERTLFYMHHPSFGNIGKMLATALPGVVYLYARKSWSARFRFHWYDVLHGLPLLLKGSAALFGYHLQSIEVKLDYWQGGWQSSPINWPWLSATVLLIYVVQVLLLVRLVYRHHQALVQLRSSDLDRNYRLLIIFVAAYSIQLVLRPPTSVANSAMKKQTSLALIALVLIAQISIPKQAQTPPSPIMTIARMSTGNGWMSRLKAICNNTSLTSMPI